MPIFACPCLPLTVLGCMPTFSKRDNPGSFIAYLISRDEVHAYTFTELWFDVGSIDMYNLVEQACEGSGCDRESYPQ